MPTIEIASINSKGLGLNQEDFKVAIIEEKKLKSHRGLFNEFLSKQNGTIIHIGNPDFKYDKDNGYFAGALVDWDFQPEFSVPLIYYKSTADNSWANQQFKFKFLEEYKSDINTLLTIALEKSPAKTIYFLTDYQFGSEKGAIENIGTISNFWEQHDSANGLRFNTLYQMQTL